MAEPLATAPGRIPAPPGGATAAGPVEADAPRRSGAFVTAADRRRYAVVVAVSCPLSLLMGIFIHLPDFSTNLLLSECINLLYIALLNILVMIPFAYLASVGHGVLLSFGVAIAAIILANIFIVIGYAEFFPWAIPGLFSQGTPLTTISLSTVWLTALAGMLITILWWMYADQSR